MRKGDILYYGAAGIVDYVDEAVFDEEYVLVAEDGSVMDNEGHPILQRVSGKSWVNNHAYVLQTSINHCCKLLMLLLKDISVINQENLNKTAVIDIPIDLIIKVNYILEIIDSKILLLGKENHMYISLRDFLLLLLMNGQLGFKD